METRDLARAIEAATGKNLDRFFDQWVYGAGYPALRGRVSWDDELSAMRVELEQTQEGAPFEAEVAVLAEVDGSWRRLVMRLGEERHVFHFALPVRPTELGQGPIISNRDIPLAFSVDSGIRRTLNASGN